MKKSYFPENGFWFKGNLHSHTTDSDGVFTPSEITALYRKNGYDFLSITDHNIYSGHSDLECKLLLLSGVEHDLKYSDAKCIHVVGTGLPERVLTGYPCRKYSPDELSEQELINMMQKDGQFIVLAHPIWSRMEPEEVVDLKGFHAIEVYNHGCENICHAGHAEIYWDMLLRRGKRIYATASDDTHKTWDVFGGWVCVKAAEYSYKSIIDALFAGSFYASSGPEITDYGMNGDDIYINCSNCREIHFVSYPPRGKSFFALPGKYLSEAVYARKGGERYIRAECVDHSGRAAWTNPIFFSD